MAIRKESLRKHDAAPLSRICCMCANHISASEQLLPVTCQFLADGCVCDQLGRLGRSRVAANIALYLAVMTRSQFCYPRKWSRFLVVLIVVLVVRLDSGL